ncbi:MAG TPA: type II secretion system major pseudopilin GspG [Sedimentisphaerales bacterium]|nr:type II secretion system major pseudopilin GspG [Sedimentisphaerales bacterium]
MNQKKNGFTIVELLVVIMIISMLVVFVAPKMFKGLGKAKRDIARAKMANIENAIGRFYLDCGLYPNTLEELVEPQTALEGKWQGPYLKKSELRDPWENPYIYEQQGVVNPGSFDLVSFGADGQQGGDGDNEDIYNE